MPRLIALILVSLAFMGGCASMRTNFSECKSGSYKVTIVVDTPEGVHDRWVRARGGKQEHSYRPSHAAAFVGATQAGDIYMVVPAPVQSTYHGALESWGHELAHVVCGNWHQ